MSDSTTGDLKIAKWHKRFDSDYGMFSYINKTTNETSWTPPTGVLEADIISDDAAPVDKVVLDIAGTNFDDIKWVADDDEPPPPPPGRPPSTGKAAFSSPIKAADATSPAAGSSPLTPTGFMKRISNAFTSPVPDTAAVGQWRKVLDPKTNRDYYVNVVTKETTWNAPAEASRLLPARKPPPPPDEEEASAAAAPPPVKRPLSMLLSPRAVTPPGPEEPAPRPPSVKPKARPGDVFVVRIAVPGVSFKLDLKGRAQKPYSIYLLHVSLSNDRSYRLEKRYSDFVSLDKSFRLIKDPKLHLEKLHLGSQAAGRFTVLPPLSKLVVEQRRKGLEVYLDELLVAMKAADSFLEATEAARLLLSFLDFSTRSEMEKVSTETLERALDPLKSLRGITGSSSPDIPGVDELRTWSPGEVEIVKKTKSKLSKLTGWSDIERLDMELKDVLTGADAVQAKAVRRFVREFQAREAAGIEKLVVHDELTMTRNFIGDLTKDIIDSKSKELMRLTAAPLTPAKLKELVYIAAERAVVTPLQAQLMCYAMTKTASLDLTILTALANLQSDGLPLPQELFGIDAKLNSPTNYASCIELLNSMDKAILPTEKLDALHACVKQIHTEAQEAMSTKGDGGGKKDAVVPLGADDFLPLFIYCVASSHLRYPQTTMSILWTLASREKLEGQMAYYVTVFESALYFIMNLNVSSPEESFGGDSHRSSKRLSVVSGVTSTRSSFVDAREAGLDDIVEEEEEFVPSDAESDADALASPPVGLLASPTGTPVGPVAYGSHPGAVRRPSNGAKRSSIGAGKHASGVEAPAALATYNPSDPIPLPLKRRISRDAEEKHVIALEELGERRHSSLKLSGPINPLPEASTLEGVKAAVPTVKLVTIEESGAEVTSPLSPSDDSSARPATGSVGSHRSSRESLEMVEPSDFIHSGTLLKMQSKTPLAIPVTAEAVRSGSYFVNIPSFGLRKTAMATIAFYKVELVHTETSKNFMTIKRFSDFCTYHKNIRSEFFAGTYFESQLPTLPPKHLKLGINHLADDFLEQRRTELEKFLRAIISIPGVERHPLTIKFLKLTR